MQIELKTIEEITNDTIAVVYDLVTHKAIKPNESGRYEFSQERNYLIICGRSQWRIEKGILKASFISRKHPYKAAGSNYIY